MIVVLYKHKHLEEQLRQNGRTAQAEILSMRTEGEGSSWRAALTADDDRSQSWIACRLQLRVAPAGEAAFEVTIRGRLHNARGKGGWVPVLYDPADHSKVVVDSEAELHASAGPPHRSRDADDGVEATGGDPATDAALQAAYDAWQSAKYRTRGQPSAERDELYAAFNALYMEHPTWKPVPFKPPARFVIEDGKVVDGPG